jgi:hypothetical protein
MSNAIDPVIKMLRTHDELESLEKFILLFAIEHK